MIYVRINEILKEKKKSKYWFIKNMEGGYQAISRIMNNQTTGIHYDTLEKICKVLECNIEDVLTIKEKRKR